MYYRAGRFLTIPKGDEHIFRITHSHLTLVLTLHYLLERLHIYAHKHSPMGRGGLSLTGTDNVTENNTNKMYVIFNLRVYYSFFLTHFYRLNYRRQYYKYIFIVKRVLFFLLLL